MKHSTGKPTKAEARRMERMMELGCVLCMRTGIGQASVQCHHICEGNRRLGHWYTIPLCIPHHCDINAIAKQGPTERELWEQVQFQLGLPQNWPESKILPRRI